MAEGYEYLCRGSEEEWNCIPRAKKIDLFTRILHPPEASKASYIETKDKRVEFPGSLTAKRKKGAKGRYHGDKTRTIPKK